MRQPSSSITVARAAPWIVSFGDDAQVVALARRVVLVGLALLRARLVDVRPTAVLAGLIWAIGTSFSSGIEIALAPELNSPM